MNITDKMVDDFRRLAKQYDGTSDPEARRELGAKIDAIGECLTEKQIPQFLKMAARF